MEGAVSGARAHPFFFFFPFPFSFLKRAFQEGLGVNEGKAFKHLLSAFVGKKAAGRDFPLMWGQALKAVLGRSVAFWREEMKRTGGVGGEVSASRKESPQRKEISAPSHPGGALGREHCPVPNVHKLLVQGASDKPWGSGGRGRLDFIVHRKVDARLQGNGNFVT